MKYILVPINNQASRSNSKNQSLSRLNDLQNWPNKVLIERYDQAVEHAKQCLEKIDGVNDVNILEHQEDVRRCDQTIGLVELWEDEGWRRQIVPFIPDKEIEAIFGALIVRASRESSPAAGSTNKPVTVNGKP